MDISQQNYSLLNKDNALGVKTENANIYNYREFSVPPLPPFCDQRIKSENIVKSEEKKEGVDISQQNGKLMEKDDFLGAQTQNLNIYNSNARLVPFCDQNIKSEPYIETEHYMNPEPMRGAEYNFSLEANTYSTKECQDNGMMANDNLNSMMAQNNISNKTTSVAKTQPCPHCPHIASSQGNLKQHVKGVHQKIRDMECPHCRYKTTQKGTLKRHVRIVHERLKSKKETKLSCTDCDYYTKSKRNLIQHIAEFHNDTAPHFLCQQCNYQASNNDDLRYHLEKTH